MAKSNSQKQSSDANLGPRNADSFRRDLHPDLKADFILANGKLPELSNRDAEACLGKNWRARQQILTEYLKMRAFEFLWLHIW